AERGYLLTGQNEFLTDFKDAEAAIRPAFNRLHDLTVDNPAQVARLKEAMPLIDQRLREFNDVVTFAASGRQAEANRIVQENATRGTTARIRDLAAAMRDAEEQLLQHRRSETNTTQILSAIATTAGSGAVLALAFISLLLVQRSQKRRDEAEQQLRVLNTN